MPLRMSFCSADVALFESYLVEHLNVMYFLCCLHNHESKEYEIRHEVLESQIICELLMPIYNDLKLKVFLQINKVGKTQNKK